MSLAGDNGRSGSRFRRCLDGRPDEAVLKWLFRGLLAATVAVLAFDLADLQSQAQAHTPAAIPGLLPAVEPYLPSVREGMPARPGLAPDGALRDPARFDLVADGRLLLEGAIDPGAAERFAAEIDKRGSYVTTVVLNSPGGSVTDALAIGRMIREQDYATTVEAGGYCASSCPLLLAGGTERIVAGDASVGVHRVYATTLTEGTLTAGTAEIGMDNAQRVSAEVQRYLLDMGIDPQVWIHAMETPKEELFYFTPDEMTGLKLATRIDPAE